ncbi:MAG: RNA methyltransferase [Lachnospiraceae bacterium]|nr:RNA methyltransferase [uncultured Acetatifactor sp.]MCI8543250.1 RNA methyltransferase [Lachnospiraceae bacterium]
MISSHSNPKVKQVAQWQTNSGKRREEGVFLAEGFKMCEEAPERDVREIYITQEALEKAGTQPALREKLERIGYETVSSEVFRKMSDTRTPQGILCVVKRQETDLERLLAAENPLLIVLEDLQDPGNLGTIVRTGEGAGVTGIVMSARTVDIYNPKTIRATMGSIYRVPFVCAENLCGAVERMREKGIRVYAAHLAGENYYDNLNFRQGTAFLIGNEGNGLSRELTERADSLLKIPMEGSVESLNAAVSAALMMYEARRQRKL